VRREGSAQHYLHVTRANRHATDGQASVSNTRLNIDQGVACKKITKWAIVTKLKHKRNAVFWDVTRVTLETTDVSEKSIAFIRVTIIGKLGTKSVVTTNRSNVKKYISMYWQRNEGGGTFNRNIGSYQRHMA
jgi:hypothetical protein